MEKLKVSIDVILYGAIAVLSILFLRECGMNSDLREEAERQSQNTRALMDTVKIVVNRAGEEQAEKLTLIATTEELKKYNQGLYAELEKQRGQVMQLISTTASINSQVRGIQTTLDQDPDAPGVPGQKWPKSYRLNWAYDSTYSPGNFQRISGFSRIKVLNDSTIVPGSTDITENRIGFKIITGLEKEGDDYKIIVKSSHPGFKVSDIEGAIIPRKNNPLFPQPSRWSWGVTFGPTVSLGGSVTQPLPFIGIGACFGLQYNIKEF